MSYLVIQHVALLDHLTATEKLENQLGGLFRDMHCQADHPSAWAENQGYLLVCHIGSWGDA
jgi:hypothetical protein